MVTPGTTVTFAPIHTFSPIITGAGFIPLRTSGSKLWLRVVRTTLCPNNFNI